MARLVVHVVGRLDTEGSSPRLWHIFYRFGTCYIYQISQLFFHMFRTRGSLSSNLKLYMFGTCWSELLVTGIRVPNMWIWVTQHNFLHVPNMWLSVRFFFHLYMFRTCIIIDMMEISIEDLSVFLNRKKSEPAHAAPSSMSLPLYTVRLCRTH